MQTARKQKTPNSYIQSSVIINAIMVVLGAAIEWVSFAFMLLYSGGQQQMMFSFMSSKYEIK